MIPSLRHGSRLQPRFQKSPSTQLCPLHRPKSERQGICSGPTLPCHIASILLVMKAPLACIKSSSLQPQTTPVTCGNLRRLRPVLSVDCNPRAPKSISAKMALSNGEEAMQGLVPGVGKTVLKTVRLQLMQIQVFREVHRLKLGFQWPT